MIADLEAGMGTLTRLGDKQLDLVLVVVEPTAKSLETGRRLVGLVHEQKLGRVVVVANRVRDDRDVEAVRQALGDEEIVPIPDDAAVRDADRYGEAPLDRTPDSPAVGALAALARALVPA